MEILNFRQYEREYTTPNCTTHARYTGFFDILQHLKNHRKITHSEITASEECIPDFTGNKLESFKKLLLCSAYPAEDREHPVE